MKYVIVSTWNGEGYSELNEAVIKKFKSDEDAFFHIVKKARQYDEGFELEYFQKKGEGRVTFDDGDDQGSFQFFKVISSDYGVVIQCNVNEAIVLNKDGYNDTLALAIKQADPDELEEIDLTADRIFIGAYDSDYDYQFVKF